MPRRGQGKGSTDSKNGKAGAQQPLPNFRGVFKQMDGKSITLQLDDNRVMEFKRTDKTKFFKAGEELKTPSFTAGDQISVEGPLDQEGYLTAVNVYWEKAAAATKAGERDGAVTDTWKDTPAAPKPEAAETKQAPAKPDPADPGPPVLHRGRAADTAREHAGPVPEQAPAPPEPAPAQSAAAAPRSEQPSVLRRDEEEPSIPRRAGDPLIRKATEAALEFTETLPSYVCQEVMSRYQSQATPPNWQAIDIVSANVVYDQGKEEYRDIAINGKPVKKKMEEMGGAWSTGEFGTVLIDLFSPATAADFRYRKESRIAGVTAKQYDYTVQRENSHWVIHMASQTYSPAYKGAVWIDPATARVLRIEMQGYGFPEEFPTDHVESANDYEYVRLGDVRQYLLPVHAETLSCQRASNLCSRNTIDFRNYHKYAGESTIEFGDPVKK